MYPALEDKLIKLIKDKRQSVIAITAKRFLVLAKKEASL